MPKKNASSQIFTPHQKQARASQSNTSKIDDGQLQLGSGRSIDSHPHQSVRAHITSSSQLIPYEIEIVGSSPKRHQNIIVDSNQTHCSPDSVLDIPFLIAVPTTKPKASTETTTTSRPTTKTATSVRTTSSPQSTSKKTLTSSTIRTTTTRIQVLPRDSTTEPNDSFWNQQPLPRSFNGRKVKQIPKKERNLKSCKIPGEITTPRSPPIDIHTCTKSDTPRISSLRIPPTTYKGKGKGKAAGNQHRQIKPETSVPPFHRQKKEDPPEENLFVPVSYRGNTSSFRSNRNRNKNNSTGRSDQNKNCKSLIIPDILSSTEFDYNKRRMSLPSPHASLNDLLSYAHNNNAKTSSTTSKSPAKHHGSWAGAGSHYEMQQQQQQQLQNQQRRQMQMKQQKQPPPLISAGHRRKSTGEMESDQNMEYYASLQQTSSGNMMPPVPIPMQVQVQQPSHSRHGQGPFGSSGANASVTHMKNPLVNSSGHHHSMSVPNHSGHNLRAGGGGSPMMMQHQQTQQSIAIPVPIPIPSISSSVSNIINPFDDPALIGDLKTPILLTQQRRSYEHGIPHQPHPLHSQSPRATSTGSIPASTKATSISQPYSTTNRSMEYVQMQAQSPSLSNNTPTRPSTAPIMANINNVRPSDVNANVIATSSPTNAGNLNTNPFSQFDPLSNASSSERRPATVPSNSRRGGQSQSSSATTALPTHRQAHTLDTASLADIAAALSTLKPQKIDDDDKDKVHVLESKRNHMITLGGKPKESTGTKKSHRRFLSHQFNKKKHNDNEDTGTGAGGADGDGDGEGGILATATGHRRSVSESKEQEASSSRHRRALSAGFLKRDGSGGEGGSNKPKPGSRPMTPTSKGDRTKHGHGHSSKDRPTTPGGRKKLGLRLRSSVEKDKEKQRDKEFNAASTSATGERAMAMGGGELMTIASGEEMATPLSVSTSASMSMSSPTSPSAEIKIRSSEQDPTPHQISIPQASEIYFHANLCFFLEDYRTVDQNFDFTTLVGMPRSEMEAFVKDGIYSKPNSPPRNNASNLSSTLPNTKMNGNEKIIMQPSAINTLLDQGLGGQTRFVEEHRPIISSLVEADDLIVEGFFYDVNDGNNKSFDTASEKSTRDRTEIAIFKSDARRQFIVVHQGSSEAQMKPVRKGEHKDGINRRFHIGSKDDDNRNQFSEEQPVVVFPPFRKAYFAKSNLEEKVFAKLDSLSEEHPFFDVVMVGHSLGGALAQLSGMRYANARPAIMVSCIVFGCPKVGNLDFRFYVNSLPNLKVMRIEYGSDPWINTPDHQTWNHAGHTISICKSEKIEKDSTSTGSNVNDSKLVNESIVVKAFKFGENRPDSGSGKKIGKILSKLPNNNKQEKQLDHDIASYTNALRQISTNGSGISWPKRYAGEDGTGVQGLNKEKRLVC